MGLVIEPFTGRPAEWDEFVRRQSGWTHFHQYGWRGIFEDVFRHRCLYLAARREGGALEAVLPLVRVRSLLFGHFLVSLPYLNYGGPVGGTEGVAALGAHAADLARADGVKLLELRNRYEQAIALPVSHRKITVVLDLPGSDPDRLWKSFDSKLRSQIRRPQKEGITVRFGPDQVRPFHAVFSRHMRDLGTPVMPLAFFEAVSRVFPDAWFGCAWLGEQPLACGAGFVWGDEIEMTWASSLAAYNRLAPNMLLYWSFMERAVKEGLRLFNFGRCSPGAGTHRFKRQWGSRDEQLWWYQAARTAGAGTPSPDDGAYSWGPRLWRHLPLAVANRLGPRLVRGIP